MMTSIILETGSTGPHQCSYLVLDPGTCLLVPEPPFATAKEEF